MPEVKSTFTSRVDDNGRIKWNFRMEIDEETEFIFDSKEEAEAALQHDIELVFKCDVDVVEEESNEAALHTESGGETVNLWRQSLMIDGKKTRERDGQLQIHRLRSTAAKRLEDCSTNLH
jgi:hypothetical protein